MTAPIIEIVTTSPAETEAVGVTLAGWLRDGDVLLLHGDLGAGKTTLAKGIAAGLHVAAVVSSPSFALVNEYEAGQAASVSRLYHLDLYRLTASDQLASIGFADLTAPIDGVTLVEWPERALDVLPPHYLLIELETPSPDRRLLCLSFAPNREAWEPRAQQLRGKLEPFRPQTPSSSVSSSSSQPPRQIHKQK